MPLTPEYLERLKFEAQTEDQQRSDIWEEIKGFNQSVTDLTDLGDNQTLIVKAADTSRANTIAIVDDTELKASLDPGTYTVDVVLAFQNASTTPGIKLKLASTGGEYSIATGAINVYEHGGSQFSGSYPNGGDADIFAPSVTTGTSTATGLKSNFSIVVTSTTVVSVQWAQNVSNAATITLKKGSYMRITASDGKAIGGGVAVANNPVVFDAYKSADQLLPLSSTNYPITLETVVKDTHGKWASSLYTIPIDGEYTIEVSGLILQSTTSGNHTAATRISVWVNGAPSRILWQNPLNAGYGYIVCGTVTLDLVQGNTIGLNYWGDNVNWKILGGDPALARVRIAKNVR